MASFIVDGQNVTVNFDYTAPIAIVVDTVDAAGKNMFRYGLPADQVNPPLDLTPVVNPETGLEEIPVYTWNDLSSDQKLNLLSNKILEFIQANARGWFISEAVRIANETAQIEAEAKYI
ncbi:MAG: hypothetical protein KQI81_09025 [Deltaproteobacteria bacterium]|nr:hypothetical protein [Deltaproteobacteria bacterium]